MAPAHAIDGPDAHDHATKQLAPELTIDGPQQDGYSNSLRTLQNDDIAVVTVPTKSRREEDGTVIIDFDPEAVPALKNALTSNDLADFFRYLVSLGY
ncbi:hypothetical protein [Brevibacterium aurantiacum]|uniref:Uncharacterized protein n=1 Tax=Brevibacterium aurantiacum TaxID=273384 RepID=A0A3Q9NPQ5_BREAU|nr:hypothetical protein [Brevibacterium aurantiacum]AZT92204.1 hypothetical protein CXR23_02785 [Brevibacterium aurantiacum]